MDFQDRLLKYAKFNMSIRTASDNGTDYYVVTLNYGTKWKIMEPVDNRVKCVMVNDKGTYGYMTETSNGVGPIYDSIDETIRYNEEVEKKIVLLKNKAEELKNIFANEPYERLEHLSFVFTTPKDTESATKKKKASSTKKENTKKASLEPFEEKDEGQQPTTGTNALESPKTSSIVKNPEASEIDRKIAEAMSK